MDLSAERRALLSGAAQEEQLSLAALVDLLIPPSAPPLGTPVERMMTFAGEERYSLGEETRLRDFLTA